MSARVGLSYSNPTPLDCAAQVIRAVILLLFWPLLQRWGYGITAREGVVMAWAGLRGAARTWP